MPPLIGLTTWRSKSQSGTTIFTVAEAYTQSVTQAGGTPLLIPLDLDEDAIAGICHCLDGILFTGGGDIDPHYYGRDESPAIPRLGEVDAARDALELALFQAATRLRLPFFGICRGFQLVNVALGGTLYIDILEEMPGAIKHACGADHARDYLAHPVQVVESSRLADILGGTSVEVNSLHHQGALELAPTLKATAFAPDGLVEACELPGYPFGLAVQWHPECLQEHAPMRSLFQAFVQAAQAYKHDAR